MSTAKSLRQHIKSELGVSLEVVETAASLASWIYKPRNAPPSQCRVLKKHEDSSGNTPQFALVYSAKHRVIFVTFKGSDSVRDFLSDLEFAPTCFRKSAVMVHSGTAALYDTCRSTYEYEFQKNVFDPIEKGALQVENIVFTGHSLGGGLAALALLDVFTSRHDSSSSLTIPAKIHDQFKCLVFEAPMVFCHLPDGRVKAWMKSRFLNFINGNDLVPRLPGCIEYLESHLESVEAACEALANETFGSVIENLGESVIKELIKVEPIKVVRGLEDCCNLTYPGTLQGYNHCGYLCYLSGATVFFTTSEDRKSYLRYDPVREISTPGSLLYDHYMKSVVAEIRTLCALDPPHELKAMKEAHKQCEGYIHDLRDVRTRLQKMQDEVSSHGSSVNTSKVVGGSASVVGGICLCAAPFTGGGSLLLAGAVAAFAGAGTSIGASFTDTVGSNRFQQEMQEAQAKITKRREHLDRSLQAIVSATVSASASVNLLAPCYLGSAGTLARASVGRAAGAGVISVAAGTYDIVTGISGLTNGHPTENDLKKLLGHIDSEMSKVRSQMTSYEQYMTST